MKKINPMKTKALYAGSFNPFTEGHRSIVERTLRLCDEVIIGIGVNIDKTTGRGQTEEIQDLFKNEPRVTVCRYDGLTVDFAREQGVTCLVRGVRNADDFQHEKELAQANYKLAGIETILLIAEPHLEHLSSSMMRQLEYFKKPHETT